MRPRRLDAVDVAVNRDSFATPSFRAGLARTLPRQHLQRSVSSGGR